MWWGPQLGAQRDMPMPTHECQGTLGARGRMHPLTIRASFLDLAVFALQGERNLVSGGQGGITLRDDGYRGQGAAVLWGGCRGWVHTGKEGQTDTMQCMGVRISFPLKRVG